VTRPTSIRDSAYAHSTNPAAEGAAGAGVTLVPRLAARYVPAGVRLIQPAEPVTRQIFTVSRRGGDRKPAVRVVLDALSAGISAGVTGECGPGRE
jgi:DNA-binding transcriptional LysR family regulator